MVPGNASSDIPDSRQSEEIQTIGVAFWNLQNLFDIEVSKLAADLEFTPVHGWDRRAFEAKVNNLAQIIRMMFDGHGPDLLGVCEIENERVANILIDAVGRDDYALAHVQNPDIQGIDTSLIYSSRVFDIDQTRVRGHQAHPRYPTRDIFEVHLKVKCNDSDLVVLVNHWPSQSPGRWETEPFRITVASHCGQLVEQNLKLPRKSYLQLKASDVSLHQLNAIWDRNVLVMGDFNDAPWSRSVMDILRAGFTAEKLAEPIRFVQGSLPSYRSYASRPAWLFNPMWSCLRKPDQGTHYNPDATHAMSIRDQFLLSRGLYYGLQGLQIGASKMSKAPGLPAAEIFRPNVMCTPDGHPREFLRENRAGFSDHFPVTTTIKVLKSQVSRDG